MNGTVMKSFFVGDRLSFLFFPSLTGRSLFMFLPFISYTKRIPSNIRSKSSATNEQEEFPRHEATKS